MTQDKIKQSEQKAYAALEQFYASSLAPLTEYQTKLKQIEKAFRLRLVPYEMALEEATKRQAQKNKEFHNAREKAAPELKAAYSIEFKAAWETYKTNKEPYMELRETLWNRSDSLFRTLLSPKLDEPDSIKELSRSTSALIGGFREKVETLSPREITDGVARDVIQDIFLNGLEPLDKVRDEQLQPSETLYEQARDEEVRSLSEELSKAYEDERLAKENLEAARKNFYAQDLASRAEARQECETKLLPLRQELEASLKAVFENLK